MLGSRLYQLGPTSVFEGFEGFEKPLGTSGDVEVWVEVDTYPSAAEFKKILAKIGEDENAGPLWGELAQVASGCPVIMGEFARLVTEKKVGHLTNRVMNKSILVDATLDEVWRAWTTLEGIKKFFAPDARLDIRPRGKYEILFDPDQPEGEKGAEGCTVLSYVPLKMLSFSWGAPPEFPNARKEIAQWVVLFFNEVGPNQTLVSFQEFGWKDDKEGEQVYEYFDRAWAVVLARLAHSFTHGPMDWEHPWRPV
jgi:uncharacterized protein YndB with AHSA1/START domain